MILRILILIGLLWLLLRLWRSLSAGTGERADERHRFQPTAQCSVCGVHLPRERAITRDGQDYCDQHAPKAGH